MNKPSIVVIYHKDCVDGTAAAAVVLRKFPEAHLFPLRHSYTPEDFAPIRALVTPDTQVYTVDCILGVRELLMVGCPITGIDHHAHAAEEAREIARSHPHVTVIFDNERSGASLAWLTLFPDEELPMVVRHVEDGDLWLWRYGENTKHVGNYLSMFENNPQAMLQCIDGDFAEIVEKGMLISLYADKEIERLCALPPRTLRISGHQVPAYNIGLYQSECGNALATTHDCAVALYVIEGPRVKISFRSLSHHNPSSFDLAHSLGGGGHQNSSGATISLDTFLSLIVR